MQYMLIFNEPLSEFAKASNPATADAKEHLGGYFVIEVASLDQALDWAAKSPAALAGSVEVRPVLPPMPGM